MRSLAPIALLALAGCARTAPPAPPECPVGLALDAAAPLQGVPVETTAPGACLAARAEAGDVGAQIRLGDFYHALPGPLPLIDRRGRELHWYRLAADHGSPQAAWAAAQLIDRDMDLQVPNDALAYAITALKGGIEDADDFIVDEYQSGRIDPGKLWGLRRWMDTPGAISAARRQAILEGLAQPPGDELEEEG